MAKFDFKKAAISHVEKVIFGIVMLVVLMGLAGANWSAYDGTPSEITSKVDSGKRNLLGHRWPEEDKANYQIVKTDILVDRALYASIDPRPLENSIKPIVDPRGQNQPVREPTLEKLEDLIAGSGRVFLQLAGAATEDAAESEVAAATPDVSKDEETIIDELRVRENVAATAGSEYAGTYEDAAMELDETSGADYGSAGMSDYEGMGVDGSGTGAAAVKVRLNGQGYHYVSVRAVFPLRDQISKFADATNQSYDQAAANFDIIHFELQRQVRQRGPNPWPEGEEGWEPVDINVAKDILDTTAGYEADVVNSVVTNGVITMPLPMRISGAWRNQATHDRIKNFVLTDEQVKVEMEMNRALLQEAVESRKTIRQSKVQKGGFSEFQFDSREIQGSLMGNENVYASSMGGGYGASGSYGGGGSSGVASSGRGVGRRPNPRAAVANSPMEKLISKLAEDSKDPKAKEKVIREWILERASVDGELLLFRYFDFSVEPGRTYRYRVRLILQNPNFGKRIADAGGLAHVVAGETRTTDWSNITDPITVQDDLKFFLTRINDPKGNSRLLPSAQMDVFHWDSKYGTMVNKAFEVRMGQPVAEDVKAEVIDAAGQVVEEMDYKFKGESFLIDAIADINIDRSFHSNDRLDPTLRLELLKGHRDSFRNQGHVLVKNEEGEIENVNQSPEDNQYKSMQNYVKLQKESTFKHLFEAKTALTDATGFSEYAELIGEEESGSMMEGMMGGTRGRSALRRKSSSRGKPGSSGGRSSSSSSSY